MEASSCVDDVILKMYRYREHLSSKSAQEQINYLEFQKEQLELGTKDTCERNGRYYKLKHMLSVVEMLLYFARIEPHQI